MYNLLPIFLYPFGVHVNQPAVVFKIIFPIHDVMFQQKLEMALTSWRSDHNLEGGKNSGMTWQ